MRDFLNGVGPFAGFSPDMLDAVADRCTLVELPAGAWLFRQDDEGDALYVVRTGRLELVREDPGPPSPVGVVGPGDSLGELSLLLGERRTLSARAIRDTELVRLERSAFEGLRDSAEFTAGLTRVIARFLQDRALHRGEADAHGSVLTVVALHPDASIETLRAAMAQIPARRRVAVLHDEGRPPEHLPRILDEAERSHDRVFLLANGYGERSPWDAFCLRQADRVIALVPPALKAPPAELDGADLVFWASPRHAGDVDLWLHRVRPRSHHFVDPENVKETLARALRRLAGLSVGVVFSGGGARSVAHIGAVAGLEESGLQIDRVGGSSFGALVAALYAVGESADEMRERYRSEFVSSWPFNDYTVPTVALLRGRKLRSALHRMLGDEALERLPRDCFTVSADLTSSELVVHRRGRVDDAVRASLALPGMLPPVADPTGRVLIDGSVLSGLPISVMADADEGPVVAVDVGGGRLRMRRRRRAEPLPPIMETISRSAIIGGSSGLAAAKARAAIVIEPDVGDVGHFDFTRTDELFRAGYDAALRAGNVLSDSGGFP